MAVPEPLVLDLQSNVLEAVKNVRYPDYRSVLYYVGNKYKINPLSIRLTFEHSLNALIGRGYIKERDGVYLLRRAAMDIYLGGDDFNVPDLSPTEYSSDLLFGIKGYKNKK